MFPLLPTEVVTVKIVSNANASGSGGITYTYSYNFPAHANDPIHSENNAKYYYRLLSENGLIPPVSGSNTLGRWGLVEDNVGFSTFSYGRMGQITKEYRIFALLG